jgi:Flp pilus assembly protein TadD
MNKQENGYKERHLRFAEAGILFVLALAVILFVGLRVADHGEQPADAAAVVQTDAAGESQMPDQIAESSDAGLPARAAAGDEDAARQQMQAEPIEPAPRQEPVTYAEAEAAFHAGSYSQAVDLFSAYVEDHPQNCWGQFMLGLSHQRAGDLEGAVAAFRAALELRPDHLKSRVNLGRALLALDRPEEALTELEAAVASAPEDADARRVLGRALDEAGRPAEAESAYLEVLRANTDDVWALNNLGLLYIQQERFAEALPPLARAAQLDPATPRILNNLGIALERTGHLELAGATFEQALAAGDHPRAEVSLARVNQSRDAGAQSATDQIDLAELAAAFAVPEEGSLPAVSAVADATAPPSGDLPAEDPAYTGGGVE